MNSIYFNSSNPTKAIRIMQRACIIPKQKSDYYDPSEPVQNRLYKSLKLWSMHADLEESFGSFEVKLFFRMHIKIFGLSFYVVYFKSQLEKCTKT